MPTLPEHFLDQFILRATEESLGVRSVRLAGENFFVAHDFLPPRKNNLFSVAKTVTALAVGIAVDEGLLSPDEYCLDLFSDMTIKPGRYIENLTIRHCLQMTSGKQTAFFRFEPHHTKRDWLTVFLEEDLDQEPGTCFHYNNPTTYVLSRVIERVSGETLLDYLTPRLFTPLGISDILWNKCRHGHTKGFSDLHLLPDDFSQIALLLLRCGRADDKQLVSEYWIEKMHKDMVPTAQFAETETRQGYGYQCWLGSIPGSFRADGMYGQFAVISPKHGAAVTITAHNNENPYRILDVVYEEILGPLALLEEENG